MHFLLLELDLPNLEDQEIVKHLRIQEEYIQLVLVKIMLTVNNLGK